MIAISLSVFTQTEQVTQCCHEMARYAQLEDLAAIGDRLAGNFQAGDFDREKLLARAENTLARFDIDHIKLRTFEVVNESRERSAVTFNAVCRLRNNDSVSGIIVSRWRLKFVRDADAWLLESMEAIPTAFSPIRHVRDCLR